MTFCMQVALPQQVAGSCALLTDWSVKCWGATMALEDDKPRGDQPNEMGNNLPAINLNLGPVSTCVCQCPYATKPRNLYSVSCSPWPRFLFVSYH
jgi:hypothetical protein